MHALDAALTLALLAPGSATEELLAQRADSARALPARDAATADVGDLAATTAPPWNPPRAVPRRRAWEQVILFPQRVATLPLSGLGRLTEAMLFELEDAGILERHVREPKPPRRLTLRLAPSGIPDGAGPGVRATAAADVFRGVMRSDLSVSHAATVRHYHDTRIAIQGLLGDTEYRNTWRPQDRFYGPGPDSREQDLARYGEHQEHVRTGLVHRWNHREPPPGAAPDEQGDPRTWASAWIGPRRTTITSGREPDDPSIEQRFSGVVGSTFNRRLGHLVYGASFASDWRRGAPHWTRGWRVLIELQRFDPARGVLALGMTGEPVAQFSRAVVELETGFSFMRDPRTIRFLGRIVDQGVTAGREHMAVSDLASLGGRSGLAGFPPGRFHDLDLAHVRVSWIFPLARRLEIDLHGETGAVFGNLWTDSNLSRYRQSFGVALRGRKNEGPVGAIGFDASAEGVRLRYALGNPDR